MNMRPTVRGHIFLFPGLRTFVRDRKIILALVICLLGVLMLLEALAGDGEISAWRMLSAPWLGDDEALYILYELRLPRLWAGVLAGISMGVAGYLVQIMTKNPLADPDLLGVTPSALACVAFSMFMGIHLAAIQVWIASLGALFTLGAMMMFFRERRGGSCMSKGLDSFSPDPLRLVLAGAALKGTLVALTSILLLLDQHTADEMRFWVMGSLAGNTHTQLSGVLIPFSLGGALVIGGARFFPALLLSEEMARSLGYRLAWIRTIALIAIALLCGVSVMLAGPISFLGMLVPTVARYLLGLQSRYMLLMCALLGTSVLLFSDACARMVAPPAEQPLNIILVLLGAPFLIGAVYQRRGGSPGKNTNAHPINVHHSANIGDGMEGEPVPRVKQPSVKGWCHGE